MNVRPRPESTKAMNKVLNILDVGTFVELGEHAAPRKTDLYEPSEAMESDGVITGYGTIAGKLAYIFAQDGEVMGGSFGEAHGRKIIQIFEKALRTNAPVIGLLDSTGFRLEDGLDAIRTFAELIRIETDAAERLPLIMAITGKCAGGMTALYGMADLAFVEAGAGSTFVNPAGITGESCPLPGDEMEWEELVQKIRSLVDILPPSTDHQPDQALCDPAELNRSCEGIETIFGDGRQVAAELSDEGFFEETEVDAAEDMVTGFIRIDGNLCGYFGNNAAGADGRVSAAGLEKAARIVDICDKFNLPLITAINAGGYALSGETEKYVSDEAANLAIALASSEIPKICLLTGGAVGSVYAFMNSKELGADYVFMWNTAEISLIHPQQGAEILYGDASEASLAKYRDEYSGAKAFAGRGSIDKIIEPADSRKYIAGALETFVNSR